MKKLLIIFALLMMAYPVAASLSAPTSWSSGYKIYGKYWDCMGDACIQNGTVGAYNSISSGKSIDLIQSVINTTSANGGGTVILAAGTYVTTATNPTLLIKSNVTLAGVERNSTIIRLGNGLQQNVIEMDTNSGLQDITIDGNYLNNMAGSAGWTTVNDAPFAHGVYTSEYWWNNQVYLESNNVKVSNVNIIDTLRSDIVIAGNNHNVEGLYINNTYTDHAVYFSQATESTVKNVWITNMSNNEVIVIGTGTTAPAYNNVLEDIHILNASIGRFTYPNFSISLRENAGSGNTVRDVWVNGTKSFGNRLDIRQNNTLVDGYHYVGNNTIIPSMVYILNGTGVVLTNSIINVSSDQATVTTYLISISASNATVKDTQLIDRSGTVIRGIGILPDGGFPLNNIVIDNVRVDAPNQLLRAVGDTYSLNYTIKDLIPYNSTTVSETGSITRNVFDYGTRSSAPPNTINIWGAGSYFWNKTSKAFNVYNGAVWQYYNGTYVSAY